MKTTRTTPRPSRTFPVAEPSFLVHLQGPSSLLASSFSSVASMLLCILFPPPEVPLQPLSNEILDA